ncbi:MAG: hypothetical protein JWO82_2299 [Akkermansiaceae bacterium]|nr:hypothetical protein [Akkermansiaceae bacterium]
MNLTELQKNWKSSHDHLPAPEQKMLAEDFARRMIRRRRFQSIWLANTFIWLVIGTGVVIRAVVLGKTDLAREWSLLPLLLVPWGFAIHFLRQHLRPAARRSPGEKPLVDSLRGELEANRTSRSQLKWVGALYLVMIPLLALAMRHLHAAGKVSAGELTSMGSFFGGILFVSAAGVAWRYFGRLSPQRDQLEDLLRHCGQD